PTISGSASRSAIACPARSSPVRKRQRRPLTDRSTPNIAPAKAAAPPAPSFICKPNPNYPCSYRHPRESGGPGLLLRRLWCLDSRYRGNDERGRSEKNHEKDRSARKGGKALLAREVMARLDIADCAGFRPHHNRMRRRAASEPAHTPKHRPVRNAGRREHHI